MLLDATDTTSDLLLLIMFTAYDIVVVVVVASVVTSSGIIRLIDIHWRAKLYPHLRCSVYELKVNAAVIISLEFLGIKKFAAIFRSGV